MSWDLVIFAISLFAFIISMIATLGCFFGKRRKWFFLLLACVVISCACTVIELQRLLTSPPDHELPVVIRSPLTPL
jgi:uncharacterized membrane protein YhhN